MFKAACCCAGGLAGTIPRAHRCLWQNPAEAQAASDQLHDISACDTIPSVVVHQHSLPCCGLPIQRVHHGDCRGSAAIELYTCAGWPDSGSFKQLQGSLQLLECIKTWCLCNTGSQSCAVPAFLHQHTQKTNFLQNITKDKLILSTMHICFTYVSCIATLYNVLLLYSVASLLVLLAMLRWQYVCARSIHALDMLRI